MRTARAETVRLQPYRPPTAIKGVQSIMESQLKILQVVQHLVRIIRRKGQKKRIHIMSARKYRRTSSISSGTPIIFRLKRKKKTRLKRIQETATERAYLSDCFFMAFTEAGGKEVSLY